METGNLHPFAQVKSMGVDALRSGIQRKFVAAFIAGPVHQPIEQPVAMSLRSRSRIRHEVVNIQRFAGEEHIHLPEAGDRPHEPGIVPQRGKLVALRPHALDPTNEVGLGQLWSQLNHDGETSRNVGIGSGEGNRGGVHEGESTGRAWRSGVAIQLPDTPVERSSAARAKAWGWRPGEGAAP